MAFRQRFSWLFAAVAVAAFAFTTDAAAHVPPSLFIVKTITNKRGATLKGVRLKSHLTAMMGPAGAEKPAGPRLVVTTTFNPQTSLLKTVVREENGPELYYRERGPGALPPEVAFLFDAKLADVVQSLRDKGIPVRTEDELLAMRDEDERRAAEVEFLSRWKGTVAWVIGRRGTSPTASGGKSSEPSRLEPQLWVEKDSFVPLRLFIPGRIEPGKPTGTWLDLRFEGGQRLLKGFVFPRLISLFDKDGNPILREELVDLSTVLPRAEEAPPKQGFSDAGNEASSEVRALIERYFETLR
jgi:hypothetical protein